MRSGWMIFTTALVFAAAPQLAGADDADVQEQLRLMQERMMLLEDKLENTNDQLEAATDEVKEQRQVLSNAGIELDERAASGVDSFLQSLEIGGWINISYWHNFNDPGNGEGGCSASDNANTGNAATANGANAGQLHPSVGVIINNAPAMRRRLPAKGQPRGSSPALSPHSII